jgi:hypothetical protein
MLGKAAFFIMGYAGGHFGIFETLIFPQRRI